MLIKLVVGLTHDADEADGASADDGDSTPRKKGDAYTSQVQLG